MYFISIALMNMLIHGVFFQGVFFYFFLFFSFANIGFPGTSSFVGELLVLIGTFQSSFILTLFTGFSLVLGTAYSI